MRPPVFELFLMAALGSTFSIVHAQAPAATAPADQPFVAGSPLKMTPNARTYGGFRFAESISYDSKRDLMWR